MRGDITFGKVISFDGGDAMPAVLVRNLSVETHRALKQRAAKSGKSTEAEIRVILDEAVRKQDEAPKGGLGTELHRIAMQYGGWDLEITRSKELSDPVIFE